MPSWTPARRCSVGRATPAGIPMVPVPENDNEQATVEALLDLGAGLPEIGAVDAVTATVPR